MKKIFSVGRDFPSHNFELVKHRSERSLLDADIVVFEPGLHDEYSIKEYYRGCPLLYESDSFDFLRNLQHWHSELKIAFDAGKTILVFLTKPETVYVDTGQKKYEGSGRNTRATPFVDPHSTYEALPLRLEGVIAAEGKSMKPAKDLGPLSIYWNLCEKYTNYEAYLGNVKEPLFVTRSGDKVVGSLIRGEKGTMLLLPNLALPQSKFIRETKSRAYWNSRAMRFGEQLTVCVVQLDTALRQRKGETPAPGWTLDSKYRLKEEGRLETEIQTIDSSIPSLQRKREGLLQQRESACELRALLFEKSKPLETAILRALSLMGFRTGQFKAEGSEFDVIFEAPEGRFLGEVEGKDNKPINVDKLSQLERNIQEDFARDGVADYAHGVLFGNGYRLVVPEERPELFTDKCISGAKRSSVTLVRTPDLFKIAAYLTSVKDDSFAEVCRKAILAGKGQIAKFPDPPSGCSVDGPVF
jgi:hypothetical protein